MSEEELDVREPIATSADADQGELRGKLRRAREDAREAREKVAALEAELEPLRAQLQELRTLETRRAVEEQLVDAARKLDCCESALRDVRRLAPLFTLGDDGLAVDAESRSVEDALKAEIALSPHWLARTRGAQADAGRVSPAEYDERLFASALENDQTDFADLIRFAPKSPAQFGG